MFEKFVFSKKQVNNYFKSAVADLKIARTSDEPEVVFRFSYDSFLKICIAISAKNGLRIKSRQGHHMVLIGELAEILKIDDINIIGQEMRIRRNKTLYGAMVAISDKQASEYLNWVEEIFKQSEIYLKKEECQDKLL